jgi:argininosuccinate synthase
MAYDPHKLSMEKVDSVFSPEDRMGALEMQNLSVLDNRAFLINHIDATNLLAEGPARRELTEILGEAAEPAKPTKSGR